MSKHKSKKGAASHRRNRERRKGNTRRGLEEQLLDISELLGSGELDEARDRIDELSRLHPSNPEVLSLLAGVCQEQDDTFGLLDACRRLARVSPHDPEAQLMLAGAAIQCGFSAHARPGFLRFLTLTPHDPRVEEVRRSLATIEEHVAESFGEYGLTDQPMWEMAQLHEEMLGLMAQGEYRRACGVADQMLRRIPDFVPALNNKSQALCVLGNVEAGAATAQRVLDLQPRNHHALANLARCLVLLDQPEQARATATRLGEITDGESELLARQAETFSFLGDDARVLAVLQQAESEQQPLEDAPAAMLLHYAAAAEARAGKRGRAEKLWKQALEISPSLQLAEENLADLREAEEERLGPWSFQMPQLLSTELLQSLLGGLPIKKDARAGVLRDHVRRALQQHPHLAALLPIALRYGDPPCRELFCDLAVWSELPQWIEQVKQFVLGQEGAYRGRVEAATALANARVFPTGQIKIWTGRDWREVFVQGFDIYWEPDELHPPAVLKLAEEGYDALQGHDWARAEKLFREAMQKDPSNPSLINNRAAALLQLGREAEALELLDYIDERFPDYFFGKVNRAHRLINQKRLAEAEALLKPLLSQSRLHITEFTSLAGGYIALLVGQGKFDAARSWLGMWERAEPDDLQLPKFRAMVRSNPLATLGRLLLRGDR